MPTVVTQTLTFNYLDEYSNIVSLYNESLLLPIQIKVGNIFALSTGTLTLCASMDNIVYNDKFVFSTQNNASINIPATQVVGSFVKLRRELTSYTNSTVDELPEVSATVGSDIVNFGRTAVYGAGTAFNNFRGVSNEVYTSPPAPLFGQFPRGYGTGNIIGGEKQFMDIKSFDIKNIYKNATRTAEKM